MFSTRNFLIKRPPIFDAEIKYYLVMLCKVNNFKVLVFFSPFAMSISQWWQFVFFREDSRKCLLGIESIFIGYTHYWLISLDESFSSKFKFWSLIYFPRLTSFTCTKIRWRCHLEYPARAATSSIFSGLCKFESIHWVISLMMSSVLNINRRSL